jgi:hypothetical protein
MNRILVRWTLVGNRVGRWIEWLWLCVVGRVQKIFTSMEFPRQNLAMIVFTLDRADCGERAQLDESVTKRGERV